MGNTSFIVGDQVEWKWMSYLIEGVVEEVYHEVVVRKIKGKNIKRNGSPEKPAFLVRSDAGNIALKLVTELKPRSKIFDNLGVRD